jgi:hypothetical protein
MSRILLFPKATPIAVAVVNEIDASQAMQCMVRPPQVMAVRQAARTLAKYRGAVRASTSFVTDSFPNEIFISP